MKQHPQAMIFVVLIFAIVGGSWFFVFQPRRRANAAMQKDIQDKHLILQEVEPLRQREMETVRKEITFLHQAIDTMKSREAYLPASQPHDVILEGLWSRARSSRVDIREFSTFQEVSAGAIAGDQNHSQQGVKVLATGNLMDVYEFLQALETWPRIIRVNRMQVAQRSMLQTGNQIFTRFDESMLSGMGDGNVAVRLDLCFLGQGESK
jgi:Tfp pilus assembly protein PilO